MSSFFHKNTRRKMLARLLGMSTDRSSRPQVVCRKGVLGNLAKFTGKHLCQILFFNKVGGLISKNAFFYRTLPMAASELNMLFQCCCDIARPGLNSLLPKQDCQPKVLLRR